LDCARGRRRVIRYRLMLDWLEVAHTGVIPEPERSGGIRDLLSERGRATDAYGTSVQRGDIVANREDRGVLDVRRPMGPWSALATLACPG